MKRLSGSIWSTIVNGILATCAVLVTTLTIRSEIVRSRTTSMGQSSTPFFETQTDWKQYFTHGRRVGPAGAGLSLVIFSDYQCPACRKLSEQLRQYQKDSAYQFAILYRHWPLPQHRFALQAALASE